MPTTVVSTVGAGKTYTTLTAWWAAKKGNIVTADQIQVADYYGSNENFVTAAADATTDATHYYVIRAASGMEFRGVTNPPAGTVATLAPTTSSTGHFIDTFVPYFRIQDILIRPPTGTKFSASNLFALTIDTNNCTVSNCGFANIVCYSSSNAMAVGIYSAATTTRSGNIVYYCVFDGISAISNASSGTKSSGAYGMLGTSGNNPTVYNCTCMNLYSYSTTAPAASIGFSTGLFINCASFLRSGSGTTTTLTSFISSFGATDYNASDDDVALGAHSIKNQDSTVQFSDSKAFLGTDGYTPTFYGNCDLQNGSTLKGAGKDESAIFTTDIFGRTRTVPWDIGAAKYNTNRIVAQGVIMQGITIS